MISLNCSAQLQTERRRSACRAQASAGRARQRRDAPAPRVRQRPPPETDAISSRPHSQPRHATGMRLALKRVAMSEVPVYGSAEYYGLHNSVAVGTTNEEHVRYTSMAEEWLAATAFDEAIGAAYRAVQGGGGTHDRNIAAPVLHEVGLLRIEVWPPGPDCHAGLQVIRMRHRQLSEVLVLREPDDAFIQEAHCPPPPPPPPPPRPGWHHGRDCWQTVVSPVAPAYERQVLVQTAAVCQPARPALTDLARSPGQADMETFTTAAQVVFIQLAMAGEHTGGAARSVQCAR
jgi:hypothetical protein